MVEASGLPSPGSSLAFDVGIYCFTSTLVSVPYTLSCPHQHLCPLSFEWISMTKGQFCPLASSAACVTALSSAKRLMRIYLQNVGSRLLRVCGGRRLGRGSQRMMPGAQESRKIKIGGKGEGRKEKNLTAFYAQHLCPPLASQDSAHPRLGLLRSRRPGLPDADRAFPGPVSVAPDLYPPLTFSCARVRSGRNRAG